MKRGLLMNVAIILAILLFAANQGMQIYSHSLGIEIYKNRININEKCN